MIARDMSYKSNSGLMVVFKFSKAAEESSDWVFMAMQDSKSGKEYESPMAKIAVFSCLDSNK
jgi:hypothetical protein